MESNNLHLELQKKLKLNNYSYYFKNNKLNARCFECNKNQDNNNELLIIFNILKKKNKKHKISKLR